MIVSFGDGATADLFHGRRTRRARGIPADVVRGAIRKLDVINAAHALTDLRAPPGNRLEALRGTLRGWHSIRVNAQWRIVFHWTDAGPTDVALTDYHE